MPVNTTDEVCINTSQIKQIISEDDPVLSEYAYFAMGVYLSVIGTLAIIGNGFVILVIVKGKTNYQKVYRRLVLNLAIADLLLASVEFPITALSSFQGRESKITKDIISYHAPISTLSFIIPIYGGATQTVVKFKYLLPDFVCTINGFWVFTMAVVDIDTLAVIAICRYITACKQSCEHLLSSTSSKKIFIIIWGYALIWTVAPLIGWNSYTKEAYGTSCTIDWGSQSLADKTYSVTIIITCFAIHLVIFIYCYGSIISKFRRAKTIKLNQESDDAVHTTANEPVQVETIVWYHKIVTSRQLTILSLAMVGTWVFAWTPYALLTAYIVFVSPIPPWLHVIPTMMAKSACLSNPVIYALTSSKFRHAAMTLVKSKKARVTPALAAIELDLRTPPHQSPQKRLVNRRYYQGEMTSHGIYIGRTQTSLPIESPIF